MHLLETGDQSSGSSLSKFQRIWLSKMRPKLTTHRILAFKNDVIFTRRTTDPVTTAARVGEFSRRLHKPTLNPSSLPPPSTILTKITNEAPRTITTTQRQQRGSQPEHRITRTLEKSRHMVMTSNSDHIGCKTHCLVPNPYLVDIFRGQTRNPINVLAGADWAPTRICWPMSSSAPASAWRGEPDS